MTDLKEALLKFIQANKPDIHQETMMQLLQQHVKLAEMADELAEDFELFDQSLIVLTINRGDYEKVIDLIC